jgi:hypothetical protein
MQRYELFLKQQIYWAIFLLKIKKKAYLIVIVKEIGLIELYFR